MKRLLLIFLMTGNLFMLPGCWDRTELNDLALITGLGIDLMSESRIELTAEVEIPKSTGVGSSGGSSSRETLIRTGQGDTVADAISDLQEKLPREVFWGQTKVILFGEKMAKKGVSMTVDFLTRHPQPRLRAQVFVVKGAAKELLSLHPPIERSSSEVLRELSKSGLLMNVTLKQFMQMITGDGRAAAVPMVNILPPQQGKPPKATISNIHKSAIFKKDKMIGQMDDSVTRGVLWFTNELKQANINLEMAEGAGVVSIKVTRASSELAPKIEDGNWKIMFKGTVENDLLVNGSNVNLMNPKLNKQLQKDLENKIIERLKETLQKVQKEMNADVFGFADVFHRKYPKEWKKVNQNWDENFPSVEVSYDLHVFIRRPGLAANPQGLTEDEVEGK